MSLVRNASRDGHSIRGIALLVVTASSLACSTLTDTSLPVGTSDPANFQTPDGALAMYRRAIHDFQSVWAPFIYHTGRLTDELNDGTSAPGIDQRLLSATYNESQFDRGDVYQLLNGMRGQSLQAAGALAKYGVSSPLTPPALRGEMYAVRAYAEIMLADLYCSGIPLSTLDFEEDFTYRPGSTTTQVYAHAIALFDSAAALAQDSARILNLARVGKGRALAAMSRDSLASAAAAVAAVPTDFRYVILISDSASAGDNVTTFQYTTVSDHEGQNGLPYRSSGDPRTAVTDEGVSANGVTYYYPNKYLPASARTPHPIASGIEARLIESEAALQRDNVSAWLVALNALRTNGQFTTAPNPLVPSRTDTTWQAGTGGVDSLRPLMDPGAGLSGQASDLARVDLQFDESAAWLFLTGHRQSDLRRLIRQYGRTQQTVYPVGLRPGGGLYGSDVNLPITNRQEGSNPLFKGCFNRGA